MFKYALMAGVMMSLAMPAYATGRGDGPSNNNGPTRVTTTTVNANVNANRNRNTNANTNRNNNRSNATATSSGGIAVGGIMQGGTTAAQGGSVVMNTPGEQRITNQGTTTVRTAPDVAAPGIWSNNPCIISASGSVSVVGFGASLGAGVEDVDCTRRANAQLLASMGLTNVALEVMCANREVREAASRAGRPCVVNAAPAAAPAPTPTPVSVAAPAPAPVAPTPPQLSAREQQMRATLLARGMDPANLR